MAYYVCIDVGATAIKYGLATEQGDFLEQGSRPALAREEGGEGILRKIVEIVQDYHSRYEVAGAAVDTPGIVDAEHGIVEFAVNIPEYNGMRLRDRISAECQIPCYVENDVNAAAAGEYWKGAAQGAASVFMMTVGTGIGGAFLLDGELVHGISHAAGEIGLFRLHGENRLFQDIASTQALIETVAAAHNLSPAALDGKKVFQMADEGDDAALSAIREAAGFLAEGMSQVCCLLNPEVIVLGGGISVQEKWLRKPIEEKLQEYVIPLMREKTRLEFAALGNDAGMTGALYLLLQSLRK